MRYLKGDFANDFIPLIPIELIIRFEHSRLFFLVKCMRILKSLHILDIKVFTKVVKNYYHTDSHTISDDL